MAKKWISLCAAVLFTLMLSLPVQAHADAPRPRIEEVEYKGSGKVEVDFKNDVRYRRVRLTVKDSSGKQYKARITDRDEDELDFQVSSIQPGKKYTFTLSGIKAKRGGRYTQVTGCFRTPARVAKKQGRVVIEDIEWDDDGELSVEFKGKVEYRRPKVTLKDAQGTACPARITQLDDDEMEICARGLEEGRRYTLTISGIRKRGTDSYTTVSKSFVAED